MATQDRSELMKKTVKELSDDAENLALVGYKGLRKADLVEAIAKALEEKEQGSKTRKKAAKAADSADASEKKAALGKGKGNTAVAKAPKSSTLNGDDSEKKAALSKVDDKTAVAKVSKSSTAVAVAQKSAVPQLARKEAAAKPDSGAEKLAAQLDVLEEEAALALAKLEQSKQAQNQEPDTIFIDKGMLIPSHVPGTRLRVLVRDPGTTFVYWDSEHESAEGWYITAYDRAGNVLDSFFSGAKRAGSGYFHVSSLAIARVSLAVIRGGQIAETKLQSDVSLRDQIKTLQSGEKWIDVHDHKIVHEAPAPGRAPEVEAGSLPKDDVIANAMGLRASPSSWVFGAPSAAPSSDALIRQK